MTEAVVAPECLQPPMTASLGSPVAITQTSSSERFQPGSGSQAATPETGRLVGAEASSPVETVDLAFSLPDVLTLPL